MRFGGKVGFGLTVCAGLALAIGSAAAQETIGEIVATIDGETLELRTLAADGGADDYNTVLRDFAGIIDVSVMGFPPGRVAMRNVVQITFVVMPGSRYPIEQEVIFAPEGMSRLWTSLDGEDLITIETLDTSAPMGAVSGRFAGRVCFKPGIMAEPDPDDCKDIEGTFTSRLPHEQG